MARTPVCIDFWRPGTASTINGETASQLGHGTGNGLAYRGAVSWMARPSDLIQIGTYLQPDSMDPDTSTPREATKRRAICHCGDGAPEASPARHHRTFVPSDGDAPTTKSVSNANANDRRNRSRTAYGSRGTAPAPTNARNTATACRKDTPWTAHGCHTLVASLPARSSWDPRGRFSGVCPSASKWSCTRRIR
jgi:hypothetical protein